MNDKLIFSDDNTLYLTFESKVRSWIKVLLIAVNIGLYCLPVVTIATASADEAGRTIFAAIAMTAMFFFSVTRSTLWNGFGRECMAITTGNFSYYRDFGLYKTPVRNVAIEKGLAAFPTIALTYEDERYVHITFCEYLSEGEYREILTTSIKTPEKSYQEIQELLSEIFGTPENSFPFSLN